MQAIILAGGFGTRLRTVVSDLPKPMAPIAGKPFLEYLIAQLRHAGLTEIIISSGYLGEVIEAHFGDGAPWGVSLQYSHELQALGTAGATKLAEPLIHSDTIMVLNGDSFFDADLSQLMRMHRERKALATLGLVEMQDAGRYGAVEIDAGGVILRFLEKGANGPGLINGGIYLFEREILALIPAGRPVSMEKEIFPALIGKGFYGVPFDAYLIDIGTPESYAELNAAPERLIAASRTNKQEETAC